MKLGTVIHYLKKIKKYKKNHEAHAVNSADIIIFHQQLAIFCYIG